MGITRAGVVVLICGVCAITAACGGSTSSPASASTEGETNTTMFAEDLTLTEMIGQCVDGLGAIIDSSSLKYEQLGIWSAYTDDMDQVFVVITSPEAAERLTDLQDFELTTAATNSGPWRVTTDSPAISVADVEEVATCLAAVPSEKIRAPSQPEQFGEQKFDVEGATDVEVDSRNWFAALNDFVDAFPKCTPPLDAANSDCIEKSWAEVIDSASPLIDNIEKAQLALGDGPCKSGLDSWMGVVVSVSSAISDIRDAINEDNQQSYVDALDTLTSEAQAVPNKDEMLASCYPVNRS
jgi:hypothetical protein